MDRGGVVTPFPMLMPLATIERIPSYCFDCKARSGVRRRVAVIMEPAEEAF